MSQYTIDINKTYKFPTEYKVVRYNDKILVILPLTANWIVLQSQEQLDIFCDLAQGHSINRIVDGGLYEESEITEVVMQIEARKLDRKRVRNITDDEKSLHLYLTNKCNLQCPHCYMFSGVPAKHELSTEEVKRLLYDFKNIGNGTLVTLSGGEPSSRHDFKDIIEYASCLGLEINLLTNGALLNRNDISQVSKYIRSVQVSIDGFSEESNSKIRGVGHFQLALNAVDAFIENGVETSIAITPTLDLIKTNSTEYIDFAKFMTTKYGVDNLAIKFAESISDGRYISPSPQYNEEYSSVIENIKLQIYGEQIDLYTFIETMKKDVRLNNCMFGAISVASNGDVYLCPEISKLQSIANIRTTEFANICNLAKVAEDATQVSCLKPCNECELMYICGGGCRTEEFYDLVNRDSFSNIDYSILSPRKCSVKTKEKFYKLMIDSNEYLFSKLD